MLLSARKQKTFFNSALWDTEWTWVGEKAVVPGISRREYDKSTVNSCPYRSTTQCYRYLAFEWVSTVALKCKQVSSCKILKPWGKEEDLWEVPLTIVVPLTTVE